MSAGGGERMPTPIGKWLTEQHTHDRQTRNKRGSWNPYDSSSYRNSITYGIDAANKTLPDEEKIPHWTPYQLRHAAVTEITLENDGNLDVARAVAGQKSIAVTQTYKGSSGKCVPCH